MPDHRESAKARRIALLVSSMGRGGAERVAATLCNAWAREGREVWLVPTFLGSLEISYPLHDSIHVRFLSLSPSIASKTCPTPIRKIVALRKFFRETTPDVIVSFLPSTNILSIVASRGLGVPLIVCERVDPAAAVEMGVTLRLARTLAYPFAERICFQTQQAANRLLRQLPFCETPTIIPNPLPVSLTAQSKHNVVHSLSGIIIAVGRLSPQKGFDGLLRAFKQGFTDAHGWKLEIWGDGPLRSSLEALTKELDLGDRARICGPTDDAWTAMSRAQIFVLTSLYEGFPNAMLEAMALGVPTVAYDCNSGPRDLTDGGRVGVLVPTGNESQLAHAMRELADDPGKRRLLGASGAEFVANNFSEAVVISRWDELFSEVISNRAG